jgi:hypothetical protein
LLNFRPLTRNALLCAVTLALAACSSAPRLFDDKNEGGFFSKPLDLFSSPEWAKPTTTSVELSPAGPVRPDELVSADGQCPPAPPEAAPATPAPAPAPAAGAKAGIGFEGGLESAGGGGAAAPAPAGAGGIALGMTECQAVRRAGAPSNVAISAGAGGQRRVVLTYLGGVWPGIYTFTGGRLKEVDAAPEQAKPKAPAKKKVKRAKSAHSSGTQREYVQ